jgi:hypothetical protein
MAKIGIGQSLASETLASFHARECLMKNRRFVTLTCGQVDARPYRAAEVGGRRCRQPGQVRKEAATTISCRVVGFHPFFALEFELVLPA